MKLKTLVLLIFVSIMILKPIIARAQARAEPTRPVEGAVQIHQCCGFQYIWYHFKEAASGTGDALGTVAKHTGNGVVVAAQYIGRALLMTLKGLSFLFKQTIIPVSILLSGAMISGAIMEKDS